MIEAPPSRYRVVERDRRLVVVDRASGDEVGSSTSPPPGAAPALRTLPEKIRFDGGAILNTHPLYDDRAPRTITLDAASARTIDALKVAVPLLAICYAAVALWQPLALVLLVLLFQRGLLVTLRRRVTAWLDVRARENG